MKNELAGIATGAIIEQLQESQKKRLKNLEIRYNAFLYNWYNVYCNLEEQQQTGHYQEDVTVSNSDYIYYVREFPDVYDQVIKELNELWNSAEKGEENRYVEELNSILEKEENDIPTIRAAVKSYCALDQTATKQQREEVIKAIGDNLITLIFDKQCKENPVENELIRSQIINFISPLRDVPEEHPMPYAYATATTVHEVLKMPLNPRLLMWGKEQLADSALNPFNQNADEKLQTSASPSMKNKRSYPDDWDSEEQPTKKPEITASIPNP